MKKHNIVKLSVRFMMHDLFIVCLFLLCFSLTLRVRRRALTLKDEAELFTLASTRLLNGHSFPLLKSNDAQAKDQSQKAHNVDN